MFGLEILLKAIGLLLVLLIPTWVGLVYVMAKRSREGYFVDVTADGVSIGPPADRYFLEKGAITRITTARFFPTVPSISIHSGRQRIIVRKLIKADAKPKKKPLKTWLKAKAPARETIRQSMIALKHDLEALIRDVPEHFKS